jgi:hypothetical protein
MWGTTKFWSSRIVIQCVSFIIAVTTVVVTVCPGGCRLSVGSCFCAECGRKEGSKEVLCALELVMWGVNSASRELLHVDVDRSFSLRGHSAK